MGLFRIRAHVLFDMFLHIQRDMLGVTLKSGDMNEGQPGNNLKCFINYC